MNRATKKSLFSFAFNKWATSFQKGLYPCMLITFNISDLSNLQAVTKSVKFSAQSERLVPMYVYHLQHFWS